MKEIQHALYLVAEFGVIVFEAVAVTIMIVSAVTTLYSFLKKKHHVALAMSRSMNFALLFILGAEIIRLVYVRTFQEILLVGCMIVIHFAISFLINWEIKREEEKDQRNTVEDEVVFDDIYL